LDEQVAALEVADRRDAFDAARLGDRLWESVGGGS
jgi:hypothetical protein